MLYHTRGVTIELFSAFSFVACRICIISLRLSCGTTVQSPSMFDSWSEAVVQWFASYSQCLPAHHVQTMNKLLTHRNYPDKLARNAPFLPLALALMH